MKAIPCAIGVLTLVGCASEPPPVIPEPMAPMNVRTAPDLQQSAMIKTSRYTLSNPVHGARLVDILNVSVDARIPTLDADLTVKEGLNFLLDDSGVKLREPRSYGEEQLYKQPLPLAHSDLGTMPLREALQVLGGEAFELQEDVVKREVGFSLKSGYVWQPPKKDAITPTPTISKALAHNQAASSESLQEANDALFLGESVTHSVSKTVPGKVTGLSGRSTFKVKVGETYRTALLRWMNRGGIKHVAIAKVPQFQEALSQSAHEAFVKEGTLGQAVAALSYQVDGLDALTYTPKPSLEMAALHPYKRDAVTLFLLQGKTLSQAGAFAAKQYGWKWQAQPDLPDYRFDQVYPMVTKRGDINQAMNEILASYPLKVQRLDESRTLYLTKASTL